MEVRTNRLEDIRKYYRTKLAEMFTEREADVLTFQLLTEFTGNTKVEILGHPDRTVTESELLKIHFGVKDLLNNKPIQYITGKAEFYGMTFNVNSKVLIPRPETEELVEQVIKNSPKDKSKKILDIGTGSGCIAISIKKFLPESNITAIDISSFALEVASENARLNNVEVNFLRIDFLDKVARSSLGDYDIVVANPPYIRQSEKIYLNKNVLDYEPSGALFVEDKDPLIFYRAIAEFCKSYLKENGWFYCELNQFLHKEVAEVFEESAFRDIQVDLDLFGNFRFILGRR